MALNTGWRFVRSAGRDMRAASAIIAASACLAALALLLALEAQLWMSARLAQLEQHGMVLLPAAHASEKITALAENLGELGLEGAEILAEEERKTLLTFWLGEEVPLEGLPVPQAIRFQFSGALSETALADITAKVKNLDAEGEVLLYGDWAARLKQLIRTGQAAMLLAGAVLLAGLIICVALAARAQLAAHQKVLEVLPVLGAGPAFLAGKFARNFFRTGFLASVTGCVLACLLLMAGRFLFFFTLNSRPIEFLPNWPLNYWLPLLLIPPFCAICSLIAARRQVFNFLARQERL